MGSATAIAYNEDEVDKPESFTDMLDEKFRSNIVTLNDFREVLAVAGMTVGLTGNVYGSAGRGAGFDIPGSSLA